MLKFDRRLAPGSRNRSSSSSTRPPLSHPPRPSPTLPDPLFDDSLRPDVTLPPPLLLLPRELLPQRPRAPPVGDGARQDNRVHPVLPRRRRIRDENNPRTVRERERDAEPAPGKRRVVARMHRDDRRQAHLSAPPRGPPRGVSIYRRRRHRNRRRRRRAVAVAAVVVRARRRRLRLFRLLFFRLLLPPSSSSPGQVSPVLSASWSRTNHRRVHAPDRRIFSENLLGA